MRRQALWEAFGALLDSQRFDEAASLLARHVEPLPPGDRTGLIGVPVRLRVEEDLGLREAQQDIIDLLTLLARRKRNAFYRSRFSGAAVRIVEQGDSWHQYPLLLRDIVDVISDRYPVYSLSAPGSTAAAMAADGELAQAVREHRPQVVLLSGGGNDLFAQGGLQRLLVPYQAGRTGGGFIDWAAFGRLLSEVIGQIRRLIEGALAAWPETRVMIHGYDYLVPRENGPRLGAPLAAFGIPLDVGARALRLIVDALNHALAALVADFRGRAVHVDLRGTIPWRAEHWQDELHPKTPGFACLAACILQRIDTLFPAVAAAPVESLVAEPSAVVRAHRPATGHVAFARMRPGFAAFGGTGRP
jgi:GDSL-like Lipase/Acylhydrolase family